MFPFFIRYFNRTFKRYNSNNFDIYINIVKDNNPYLGGDFELAKKRVEEYIEQIDNQNVYYVFNENRGGDIGGFLLLCKNVVDMIRHPDKDKAKDYKYVMFLHSKTKLSWRKDLCQSLFNIRFAELEESKNQDIGLMGSRKWVHLFDPKKQQQEFKRFEYHLIDLCKDYKLDYNVPWYFIAGTMFLANIKIIEYIVSHNLDGIYSKLNKGNSIDINWLNIVTNELNKNPKGAGNDLQYRLMYNNPLHPDYMIEHTYERIIGLICQHLKLRIMKC
jgi:hypothetical protein